MTKASTKKGMAGKLLAAGCSLALAASLTPAAALTALAVVGNPTNGDIQVVIKRGSAEVNGFASADKVSVNLHSKDVQKVKGNQSTLWFDPVKTATDEQGSWNVITSSDAGVVSFDEIFKNAKGTGATAASYWQPGAKLTVSTGAAAVTGDPTFTYEQVKSATSFYPNTTEKAIDTSSPVSVTPGIAITGTYSKIQEKSVASAAISTNLDQLKAGTAFPSVLSMGLSGTNYDVANMAQWMGQVATITITLPEQEYTNVPRIYGEDWSDTMNDVINQANFAATGNFQNFVVASSNNYQDALTASGLAGALKCPLLLTDKDALTQQAADQITALANANGANVYVIGGPLAVSDAVVTKINQLPAISGKIMNPVTRLAGETAADTSLAVYGQMAKTGGADMTKAIVTTSIAFQDAMSISPYTYSQGIPVVLTGDGNVLGTDTLNALKKQSATAGAKLADALILGGNLAVSSSVEGQLFANGLVTVNRIGEATCWETSNAIAEYLSTAAADGGAPQAAGAVAWASTTTATVATGDNYLDALVASQYCAMQGQQALLLVGNGQDGDYCVSNFIDDTKTITKVNVIGGPQAVSPVITAKIHAALGN